MHEYLSDIGLISPIQSGFQQGDSTVNRLLPITHDTFQGFENHYETRAVFVDISKAFYRVSHEGLRLKLKSNGIDGHIFLILKSFLSERIQRVVLNCKMFSWELVLPGIPQRSVLGPLFFLA